MSRLDLALGALVLSLAAVLAAQWAGAPEPIVAPAAAGGGGVPAAAIDGGVPRGLEPISDYAEIADRVLFIETRRPLPTVAEGATEATDQAKETTKGRPQLRLTGLILDAAEPRYALVEDAAGARLRLAPGDAYQGWQVQSLAAGRMVLGRRGRTETYLLREFAANAATGDTDRRRTAAHRERAPRRERP